MPSVHMPYVNIALDGLGLLVMLVILLSCVTEPVRNSRGKSKSFMTLLVLVIVTLIFDLLSWIGEGNVELSMLTSLSNTVAVGFSYFTIICFIISADFRDVLSAL